MKLPEPIGRQVQILALCNFNPHNLQIHWDQKPVQQLPEQVKLANEFWEMSIRQNPLSKLYNGLLCRLRHFEFSPSSLVLTLGVVEYKTHLFAILNSQKQTRNDLPNMGLGVSAVIISDDDQVLFMKRSDTVAIYPGKYDVFGGHIDTELTHGGKNIPDPFQAIKTELDEEINLKENKITNLEGIGLIKNQFTGQPELIFRCKTSLDSQTLIEHSQQAKDSAEYTDILSLPNKSDSLQQFCLKNTGEFSPSGLGNIWVHSLRI